MGESFCVCVKVVNSRYILLRASAKAKFRLSSLNVNPSFDHIPHCDIASDYQSCIYRPQPQSDPPIATTTTLLPNAHATIHSRPPCPILTNPFQHAPALDQRLLTFRDQNPASVLHLLRPDQANPPTAANVSLALQTLETGADTVEKGRLWAERRNIEAAIHSLLLEK